MRDPASNGGRMSRRGLLAGETMPERHRLGARRPPRTRTVARGQGPLRGDHGARDRTGPILAG